MKIRPVAPADRHGLDELLHADRTFRDDEVAVALELIDHAIHGTDDYAVLVAEVPEIGSAHAGPDGGIGGYVCYGPTPMTEATYDLYWIVTHPSARGRGLATALIQAMETELRGRGATAVRVETSETEGYHGARRLYQRLGYPEVAQLADFYRPGDGLVLYYKRL